MTIFSSTDFEFLSCLYTYQVTQNISGSPIERQWGYRRYPGWLDRHVLTLSEIRSCDTIAYRMYLVSRLYTEAFSKWPPICRRHFQMHLLAQKCCLLIHPSLNFVSTWLVTSKTALAQIIETFRNATLTVTVTVRGARRLWRHRIVCIWNAPNRRPNRKCQHMTVSGADNRMRFTVSGYAKFHQIFRENDIDLFYFNKQLSKFITHL